MERPEISLIVPMYNEEEMIDIFFEKIVPILKKVSPQYEILCINDGSDDRTAYLLSEHASLDSRIKAINLSRNFGKEAALTAGLDYATGKAVIPIDCDLQDPPELIEKMYQKWVDGYHVVLAKRVDRSSDSLAKRLSSYWFYKTFRWFSNITMPENVGDYRLMDRQVVEAIKRYPERNRFMKGLFASLGFNQYTLTYSRPERAAGKTKWNYLKLYSLAIEGIISFTTLPLKLWSYLGLLTSASAFMYGTILIGKTLIYGVDVPGYASIMVVVLFMNGLVLISLGVMGEYISRIFYEVKQRPLYIIVNETETHWKPPNSRDRPDSVEIG